MTNVPNHVENAITRAAARREFPKLNTFRDCFEGAMDFDTALGCAGLSDLPEITNEVLKRLWAKWEAAYDTEA